MHFGPKCHWPEDLPEVVAGNLVNELKTSLQADNRLPPIFDVALLSGDFTWGGLVPGVSDAREKGFRTAECLIEQLVAQQLIRKLDDIILCPGNHDIAWSRRLPNDTYEFQPREEAERGYREFVQRALQLASPLHRQRHLQTHLGHVHLFSPDSSGYDYAVLALNSTRIEGPEHAGIGYVGYDQVYDLVRQIESRSTRRPLLLVAALHHHLHPIEAVRLRSMALPAPRRKLSFMTDASEVLETLLDLGACIVLHGHMHLPTHYYHGRMQAPDECERVLGISGAGSVSLGRASRNINSDHHFQVVQILENHVSFFSFRAPLLDAGAQRTWRAPEYLMFTPDPIRSKSSPLLKELDRHKVGRHLFEQRLFDSVGELAAWIRKDPRARNTIQNQVKLSGRLNARALQSFEAAFAAAEQHLASPEFFKTYVRRIEEDRPKLLNRFVVEEMNAWTAEES